MQSIAQGGTVGLGKVGGDHRDLVTPARWLAIKPGAKIGARVSGYHIDHNPAGEIHKPRGVAGRVRCVRRKPGCLIDPQHPHRPGSIRVVHQGLAVFADGVHDRVPGHPKLSGYLRDWAGVETHL
jgi:hypothetical protein